MNCNELLKWLMNKLVKFIVDGYGDYFVKGMNIMDYFFVVV